MNDMITGSGEYLKSLKNHPYIGADIVSSPEQSEEIVIRLNKDRDNGRGPHVAVDYYFEVENGSGPMKGLEKAAKMILEHGTLKPWHSEGDAGKAKPGGYDDNMSWALDVGLLGYNRNEKIEAGIVSIAYPLKFFDKTPDDEFPLAQFMMAAASEPFSAFSFYKGAKVIDIKFPRVLAERMPGVKWPHRRVREYLGLGHSELIIGTIVKPKTGLTPALFSDSVVQAALAGARFTKADENMHVTLGELPEYVGRTAEDLKKAGFDLGKPGEAPKGPRFLFAPHITANPERMVEYARAAVEAGANALMFSPYYGGGFQKLAEIAVMFDVPVYSHTAGMNVLTGSWNWGIDASIMYRLAARFGAAFMQLTAVKGYLKPDDVEKKYILAKLRQENLEGDGGMTLVVAGGIGAGNIGTNMEVLGMEGRMYLAGTSVYSHPDGPASGVKAIIQAYDAYCKSGITDAAGLTKYAESLGSEGLPLKNALK